MLEQKTSLTPETTEPLIYYHDIYSKNAITSLTSAKEIRTALSVGLKSEATSFSSGGSQFTKRLRLFKDRKVQVEPTKNVTNTELIDLCYITLLYHMTCY